MSFFGTLHDSTSCETHQSRSFWRITWVTLLVLFLLNLGFTGFLAVSHDKTSDDALSYYALAVNLYEGQGLSRDYKSDLGMSETSPPFMVRGRFLYPYLVSLAFHVFGVSIATSNLVAAFFKALLVIPIVLIAGRTFHDDTTGLVAGLIYTVNPAYIGLGTITMAETTVAAFYYICIALLLRYYQSGRRSCLVWAGVSLSLAYLTRPEGLLLILLGLVTIALGSRRWSDAVYLLVAPLLTFTLIGWIIYGQVGLLSPYATSLTTLPDWADFYVMSGFTWVDYLDRVGGLWGAGAVRVYNALLFLKNTFADGLWLMQRVGLLPFTFIPAIVVALFRPLERRDKRYLLVLTAFIAAQFVLTIGYPGYPRMSADFRHGQIIGPFLIVLAAAGLVQLCRGCRLVRERRVARLASKTVGGLLIFNYALFCVIVLSIGINDILWVPDVRGPLVEASAWSRENLPADAVIMSRKPAVVNHYAGRTTVIIPTAPYADIMTYVQQHGGTHLLMTEQERSGLPNLVQGMELYAGHFRNVYTTDMFAITAIASTAYPERPVVEDDWYVGPENVRGRLYEWSDLWDFAGSSAFRDVWDIWSQWLIRFRKNAWSLAKDREVPTPLEYPVGAQFGDEFLLCGYDLNTTQVRAGGTLELTLYWRSLEPSETDFTVFTHMLDEGGIVRAQKDNPPIAGTHPTSSWSQGEFVRDRYDLQVAPDAPAGRYTIATGMYDPRTGERLLVRDETGQELPERRILLGPVEVK